MKYSETEIADLMVWTGHSQTYIEDSLQSLDFLEELESKMIKESIKEWLLNNPDKKPEIKILTHIVGDKHIIQLYEIYHKGTRYFISDGLGTTKKEAILSALLNYRSKK